LPSCGIVKRDVSDGTLEALQKIVSAIRQRFGQKLRICLEAEAGAME
jgi:hypothetical protein